MIKHLLTLLISLVTMTFTYSQGRDYTFVESKEDKLEKDSRLNLIIGLSTGGGSTDMSYSISEKAPALENSDISARNYKSNLTEFNLNTSLTYTFKNIFVGGIVGIGAIKSSNATSIYTNINGVVTQRIDEDQSFPKSRLIYGGTIGYDLALKGGEFYLTPEFQFVLFNIGPDRSFFETDQFSDDRLGYNDAFKNRAINKFMLALKIPTKQNRMFSIGLSYQIHNYEFENDYLKEKITDYDLNESFISLNIGYQIVL